jgi:hypothetical protein
MLVVLLTSDRDLARVLCIFDFGANREGAANGSAREFQEITSAKHIFATLLFILFSHWFVLLERVSLRTRTGSAALFGSPLVIE